MAFIGIISDCKSFEKIKENLNNQCDLDLNLIHINKNSIENIKNIRFEVIIIDSNLIEFSNTIEIVQELCSYAKYLVINTDINLKFDLANKINVITYGLNQKSTITVSSITETDILIYLQRDIKNINNKIIEIGEKRIKLQEKSKLKTYEILIIYIILLIYNKPIMDEL